MVFLDGVDVNRIPLRTLRSHIAMVPQDAFLFSLSLADNVAYGLPATDPRQVNAAAERAQLAKDVRELPHGYDTIVGERGVMLSGGQRQRTALARALALDPKILILDDTLSAVDAETEAAIQQGLREVFRGRTVVVVASRVSTVRDADRILVLDAGRLIEQGTHAELVARGGLYARLAHDQEAEERAPRRDRRGGGDGMSAAPRRPLRARASSRSSKRRRSARPSTGSLLAAPLALTCVPTAGASSRRSAARGAAVPDGAGAGLAAQDAASTTSSWPSAPRRPARRGWLDRFLAPPAGISPFIWLPARCS